MTSANQGNEQVKVIRSSGNVFADLGFPEPEIALAKAALAAAIARAIEAQQLTQDDAGRITGLDQPRISAITRGHLRGFSIDRLFRALNALGQDVDVFVSNTEAGHSAHLKVTVDSISR
jgi:predicted XRE-type DNA-binding protein